MSVLVLLALFFRACFCSTFPPLPTPHPTQSIVYASSQAEVVAGIADYTIIKLTAMISVEAEIAISNVAGLVIDGQSIYGFDGGDQNRCLKVKGVDSLMIKDLTLQNGQNIDGGCVRTDASTVTFLRVTFSACKATYYSGIIPDNNNMQVVRVLILGPEDTPYENGFYFFEITFPNNYPYLASIC